MRVAIIGGGPAGSVCASLLQRHGCVVDLFDRASQPGGRAGSHVVDHLSFDYGAQFLRPVSNDPALEIILSALPGFKDKFTQLTKTGVLGIKGGYLDADTIGTKAAEMATIIGAESYFKDYVEANGENLFAGYPSFGSVWHELIHSAGVNFIGRTTVNSMKQSNGKWILQTNTKGNLDYDAAVLAVDDTHLVAKVIEDTMHSYGNLPTSFSEKLLELTNRLRSISYAPLYSCTVAYESKRVEVPYKSVFVDGTRCIQWLRVNEYQPNSDFTCLTAISRGDFAQSMLDLPKADLDIHLNEVNDTIVAEVDDIIKATPSLYSQTHLWTKGITKTPLGLNEACLSFEPWSLAILGDYFTETANMETALLSGIRGADRILQWSTLAQK